MSRTCVTLSSVDGILTAQSHDRFQRHSRSPTFALVGQRLAVDSLAVRTYIKEWVCLVYVEHLAGFGVVAVGRNGLSTDDTLSLHLP